ncbi:unnamed protein product [Aspergillus oryzae]|nr:unnamed protein product [Aspergillus oryzae]GMF88752.1 unnamed protein product [Aspergillus oryzae]GMG15379.1 unnamed protein product [Aspergillus oryzae]
MIPLLHPSGCFHVYSRSTAHKFYPASITMASVDYSVYPHTRFPRPALCAARNPTPGAILYQLVTGWLLRFVHHEPASVGETLQIVIEGEDWASTDMVWILRYRLIITLAFEKTDAMVSHI